MVLHGLSLHQQSGRICLCTLPDNDAHGFIGTFPWDLLAAADRHSYKTQFGLTLVGVASGYHGYGLKDGHLGKDRVAFVRMHLTPSTEFPVASLWIVTGPAVRSLSGRERDVARLLPDYSSKEIAKQLKVSTSTVETVRQRIAAKAGVFGHALIGWCAEHREVI